MPPKYRSSRTVPLSEGVRSFDISCQICPHAITDNLKKLVAFRFMSSWPRSTTYASFGTGVFCCMKGRPAEGESSYAFVMVVPLDMIRSNILSWTPQDLSLTMCVAHARKTKSNHVTLWWFGSVLQDMGLTSECLVLCRHRE